MQILSFFDNYILTKCLLKNTLLKFGSGYRIYYTEIDNTIVLLINGGDKSNQSKDIEKAKSILQEWRNLQ